MNGIEPYDAISRVLHDDDKRIVIYSSLIHFRLPWEQLKWPLMGALRRLIAQGRTLIIPAFTLSFCQGKSYHHLRSRSETGILADWFMELFESRRSPHPIYSFVIAGPDRDRMLTIQGQTTWDSSSIFGFFYRENVRFVMLGVDAAVCTQIHYYEEEAQVPYRFYKQFCGRADFGQGEVETCATMFVRRIDCVGRVQLKVVNEQLLEKGLTDRHSWQGGVIQSFHCQDLARVTRDLLRADPFIFLGSQRVEARHAIQVKEKRQTSPSIKIALLASHNLELLKTSLETGLGQGISDQEIQLFTPPIGQLYREMIESDSALSRFHPDFVFFTERLEDIFHLHALVPGLGKDLEPLKNYLEMLRQFADRLNGVAFVNRFTTATIPVDGGADYLNPQGVHLLVAEANRLLEASVSTMKNVFVFDIHQTIIEFSGSEVNDPRLWFLGRFPYSQPFSTLLAERYMGVILAMTGRTARMLVLDLDNTLWGGVLGEEGLKGLALGGDYPGNAFLHFQKTILQLMQRGIALAVASKNDEKHALETLNSHPHMVIRQQHLAAWRINWEEKWRNVLEMANEVGLGLENILFVDDNPGERARMRMNLPAVKVVDLPEDPARYAQTLLAQPWLACVQLTQEDRSRASRYVAKKKMALESQGFTNHEEFCATLAPKLHIVPLSTETMARAVQLIHKTNQFNTTTRRFTQVELELMIHQDHEVLVLGLEDRFSEFENIGLAVLRWGHPAPECLAIELFLLSCRVLGRGIESGFLAWLADRSQRRHAKKILGRIVHSERNTPVRDLYRKHGFVPAGEEGIWELIPGPENPKIPPWMTIVDRTETHSHE
ncbi:MAG TPA: HAD-IIIC family phosphatase [Magnetococcales bacterium]|nr:HAD-IIIC family phosphatase [Magnetococcales bacterium]